MRGGGVEEQLKDLEAFFGKHKGLEDLLHKRIVLDVVLDKLSKIILHLAFDKNGKCEYYESYEDIGIKKTEGTLILSDATDKYNLQIVFRNRLIDEIRKNNISEEDIDGIRTGYTDYKASLDKLYEDNSKISNPYTITRFTQIFTGVSGVPEQKKKLFDYLKKLDYLFETEPKYNKIDTLLPIPNPHNANGGGSYKKTNKKNILGKERCIYKKSGDRKEYIKYKGNFIAVREYKKLSKTR
jgi:hypothetical protein